MDFLPFIFISQMRISDLETSAMVLIPPRTVSLETRNEKKAKAKPLCLSCRNPHCGMSVAEFLKDPYVTPCGHLFDRQGIDSWLKNHDRCRTCEFPLSYKVCPHVISPRPAFYSNVAQALTHASTRQDRCLDCEIAESKWYQKVDQLRKLKAELEEQKMDMRQLENKGPMAGKWMWKLDGPFRKNKLDLETCQWDLNRNEKLLQQDERALRDARLYGW